MNRHCIVLALIATALAPAGCAGKTQSVPLAQSVDLNRMYGGWYIVATIPNGFEKGMVAPYDVYSKRGDGEIREDFYMRRGSFTAKHKHFVVHDWVKPGTHNAHWRVQVLWPVNLPFLVLYVDPDYRFVLYGEDDRNLGWIYSRDPTLSDSDFQALLLKFKAVGYDTTRFRKIVQRPIDIGQPGYWSDDIKP